MGRRSDAALTFLVGLPVALGVVVFRPPLSLDAILVGVVGTFALEAALLSQGERVRTLWSDRTVRAVAVVGALVGVAVAVAAIGPNVLVVVLSGLVTYLVLLLVVELRDRMTRRR